MSNHHSATVTRADVVAEARRWIGTPYVHQARQRGVGCDCAGLIGGVALALGLVPPQWWEQHFDPEFGGYARVPDGDALLGIAPRFMTAIEPSQAGPGDVVLIRWRRDPQHFGLVADHPAGGLSVIHAASQHGRVLEQGLGEAWRRRTVAAYRLPGVQA